MRLVALLLLLPAIAGAEPYLTAFAGPVWWDDTSNGDQVESGSEAGWMLDLAAGASWDGPGATISSELALGYLAHDLHGRNGGGAHDTADGSEFGAVTAGLRLWPGLRVGPVVVYGGGGGGVAYVHGLGADDVRPWWQAGAGVRWRWLDLGYRHTRIGAQLDGYRLRYDSHALALGLRW